MVVGKYPWLFSNGEGISMQRNIIRTLEYSIKISSIIRVVEQCTEEINIIPKTGIELSKRMCPKKTRHPFLTHLMNYSNLWLWERIHYNSIFNLKCFFFSWKSVHCLFSISDLPPRLVMFFNEDIILRQAKLP